MVPLNKVHHRTGHSRRASGFKALHVVWWTKCILITGVQLAASEWSLDGKDTHYSAMNQTLSAKGRLEHARDTVMTSRKQAGFSMRKYLKSDVHIDTNTKPFYHQTAGDPGVHFSLTGEPKSGTTWLGRTMVWLALNLCGAENNPWCEMGAIQTMTISTYKFEMLEEGTEKVFMHYEDHAKHSVPGARSQGECGERSFHRNGIEDYSPCWPQKKGVLTRDDLDSCLPSTSPTCMHLLPPLDPHVWRVVLILRDPRDVVLSERMHRIERRHEDPPEPNEFVRQRFEIIIHWTYVRWAWHSGGLGAVSHIVYYEDLHNDFLALAGLAEFMGLQCSHAQARNISDSLQKSTSSSSHDTDGLAEETKLWMNDVMLNLLPEEMLHKWGFADVTDVHEV